jgi:rhodanese-related sulfurtransferase
MLSLQPRELTTFTQTEPGAQLLDVREGWELQQCRIQLPDTKALHIPMQEVPARLHEIDAKQPVVCICHHGVRSAQVVAFLQRQGLARVYNLAGGVDAWSTQVDPTLPRY